MPVKTLHQNSYTPTIPGTALEHLIIEIEFNHARLVVTTIYRIDENNNSINNLISEIVINM